jgi:hypothetical protein
LSLLAALVVLVAGFLLTSVLAAGIAQRLAFGAWLGWLILAGLPRGGRWGGKS